MKFLTREEKDFLDVFLHEATTHPFFHGPASQALHAIGVEYRDITYLAWAYDQEVPRTGFGWGHSAETAPPLPWPTRDSALRRDKELRQFWEEQKDSVDMSKVS